MLCVRENENALMKIIRGQISDVDGHNVNVNIKQLTKNKIYRKIRK